MKIVKRVLALGGAIVAVMGGLAAPAGAAKPSGWTINCSNASSDVVIYPTDIHNAVRYCREAGGHPTGITPSFPP